VSDPNYPNPQQPYYAPPPAQGGGSGGGLKTAILFGAVIALIAANIYLFLQIDGLKQELSKYKDAVSTEITQVKEASNVSRQTAQRNLDTLKDELEAARRQAAMAVGQAKVDATKHAEDLARRLEQQQRAADQAVRGEISRVGEATAAANQKISEVGTEVSTVKTEVASTKSELDKTIATLKSVQGDMGVQSGLIATNGKELAALRALGERNYFEFNLGKTKQAQRVGDIMMQLKRTDQKKNKYTVEIVADDKRTEKKDKGVNEPVQFYTSKARQPYEIVVNSVGKDVIQGYLATPKVQAGR
jgi:hypothetical protein